MGLPEKIYIFAVCLYVFFFFLFLRYFAWKNFATKNYWSKRRTVTLFELKKLAKEKNRKLPMFSILVPAREEAEVIGQTIEHLSSLNYPSNLFEIIIITDEKELQKGAPVTTQQVVEAKIKEFRKRKNVPVLKHVMVPYDFDGYYGGTLTGKAVPSTKGRALNYGLAFIDKNSDICGFYDAESHPEQDVLLYIAYRWLVSEKRNLVWQGPVFQVRNFFFLSPITKVASLYQALAHEWYMPWLMKQLPFVGGTNLFIESRLLREIGGFDYNALTEDLEIGVRAFLEKGAWPEYFPYISTEQTPQNYKAFFRQRLRWASGHIQVVEKFKKSSSYDLQKKNRILRTLLLKGEVEWILYQLAVLVPPVIFLLSMRGFVRPIAIPVYINYLLKSFVFIYVGFTYYIYFRYLKYMKDRGLPNKIKAIVELLALPVAGFLLPLPYSYALVLRALNRQPKTWCKTPRTREVPDVSLTASRQ